MKRMSNVNSLSAILDRLIIENLKIIQFANDGNLDAANQQNIIITELKSELDIILNEIHIGTYSSIKELRTYTSDTLFENLFRLCLNNYCVSKYDKLKIEECNGGVINITNLKNYILNVRFNLEERSKSKNSIDDI